MEIQKIMENFCEKMAEIALYQSAVKDPANKRITSLIEYKNRMKDNPDLLELSRSRHKMTFYDAKTGYLRSYGYREKTIDDQILQIKLHQNKQYCWLLAEAYEEFEDFLEAAYAFMGFKDQDNWPLRDYGNITIPELSSKDFEWYLEKSKNKKDVPSSILNHFRANYPNLAKVETNNRLRVNLKLAIVLIAFLRHIIVHKGGIVDNRADFTKLVLTKVGLFNNGEPNPEYLSFIEQHFGGGKYENNILLLEVRIRKDIPLDFHYNVFGTLTGYLMAYASLIYENIELTSVKQIKSCIAANKKKIAKLQSKVKKQEAALKKAVDAEKKKPAKKKVVKKKVVKKKAPAKKKVAKKKKK